jgi:hypothetical protein
VVGAGFIGVVGAVCSIVSEASGGAVPVPWLVAWVGLVGIRGLV